MSTKLLLFLTITFGNNNLQLKFRERINMSKINVKNNNLIDKVKNNVIRHNIPIGVLFAGIIVGIIICALVASCPCKPDYKMVNQYKTLQQQSVDDYNFLLAKSQKNNGELINIDELGVSYKVNNIEEYYNSQHNITSDDENRCNCKNGHKRRKLSKPTEYKETITKLNNLLTTTNDRLKSNLKKVNNAIINNVKVDYNSLKVTNKDIDAKLKPVVDKYNEDWQARVTQEKIGSYVIIGFFIMLGVIYVGRILLS